MNIYTQALIVFVVAIAVDVVWGFYIRRTNEGKAIAAANFAVLLMGLGAINVISYTQNKWMLIPIIVGNWIGTYAVVKWDHKKNGQ